MLKDGQKDIITIKSNDNKQTYHIAARICSSKNNWGSGCGVSSQGSFPDIIVHSQLCRHGLNISSDNSRKD